MKFIGYVGRFEVIWPLAAKEDGKRGSMGVVSDYKYTLLCNLLEK
jgi:hypothetical protein